MIINNFKYPFNYWIIDNFFEPELANQLSEEFLEYNNPNWFNYNNPLENKKTINNYYFFPSATYKVFFRLSSNAFVNYLNEVTEIKNLIPDLGLHGAGWHIHEKGGKVNIHLDYSVHPKLGLQRKLNLIIYLTKNWNPSWGGSLEFWNHDPDTNKPLEKAVTIENIFNRAILFDTTQNSWHGFPTPLNCPEGVYRKSIAMYYLTYNEEFVEQRSRALYAPSEDQKGNEEIERFIIERSK